MPKSIIKLGVILLATTFLAAACSLVPGAGNSRNQTVELTWWKTFDDARTVQPLIEEFQKVYPNVRINYVQKDIETYEDELIRALAAGRGPDIFTIHNDWLPKHKEIMVPAPENIVSLREFKDSFVNVAVADLISENKIYALPLAVDVLALYYNKDILASANIPRPPATWEELVAMVPRLTRQDNFGNFQRSAIALGTADNVNRVPDILELLMLQNHTALYSQDFGVATFDQTIRDAAGQSYSPGARALEFYTQFANPAKVTYTWNGEANHSIDAFTGGQVGMVLSYSYLQSTLVTKSPFLNYGVATVPQISGSDNKVNFANYWAEGVAKQSQNQEIAWQFLKFITSKDVLAKYYEVQKQPSSRIDILEQQLTDPEIGIFAENVLSAASFYKPDSDAVEKILVQAIGDVVLRNISPQEAISAAAQKVNLLLRNY